MSTLLDIMRAEGLLDEGRVAEADRLRREQGLPLATALVRAGAASEQEVAAGVAKQAGLPYVPTGPGDVDPAAAALLPGQVARELGALPVAFAGADELVVAVARPADIDAAERIEEITGMRVTFALTSRADLLRAIDRLADDLRTPQRGGTKRAAPAAEPRAPSMPPPPESKPSAKTLLAYEQESAVDLDEVLMKLVEAGGSDLHLTAGAPPAIRVRGELVRLDEYDVLQPVELQKMIYGILTQRQREVFETELELDLSYTVPGRSRFRVNVFRQRDALGAVMRVIPFEIKALEDLGVPSSVATLAQLPRGFVLVTGPTGSGKSTTLASVIDLINRNRAGHIMTVE
ncbi:MAG: Flp pilus assembly complex ATPase component TadA, partial [Actinomycetota bacterium]|nr:Flp pilus assembly complex ATPase component TadA [Actinomycetota bacterium]